MRWQTRTLLATGLLLAFALRLHHLDAFSFWLDEGLTPLRSGYDLPTIWQNINIIQGYNSPDTHPPLYYTLIHFTRALLGDSDFAFRYPSLLWGMVLLPLIYQLGRKIGPTRLALCAFWLAVINPQQIWYAQEARMYTQLVTLMAASSYVLLQAHRPQAPIWRNLSLYLLMAGFAFYTHYTAAFLILGQGLLWLPLLWRARFGRLLIVATLFVGAIIATPFSTQIIGRLRAGPETDYHLVPPHIFFSDIVRGFSFGRTLPFDTPLWQGVALCVALLLLVGIWHARPHRPFLLIYLLSATLGLLLGSYLFKPMYLGAHHIMVGSPAFLLLLATALNRPKWSLILLAPLLFGTTVSLNNLYNNPTYAKEAYRTLVQYIEEQAAPDDLVLYNNAILLTLHHHYQTRSDLSVTAYPIYPHAANASTSAEIAQLTQQYNRIWFIPERPRDGRDDQGIVETALNQHAVPTQFKPFFGRFSVVHLQAYQTQNSSPNPVEIAKWPSLYGYHIQHLPRTIWLSLFWHRSSLTSSAPLIEIELRDAEGVVWSRQTAPAWQGTAPLAEADWVQQSYPLPVPHGLPFGQYSVWLKPEEERAESWLAIASADLLPSYAPYEEALAEWDSVQLLDIQFADEATYPGQPLPAIARWRVIAPLTAPIPYTIQSIGRSGRLLREDGGIVGGSQLAWQNWPVGAIVAQHLAFYPPPNAQPDLYQLSWTIEGETRQVGRYNVQAWPFVRDVPAHITPMPPNQFGNLAALRGYELTQSADDTLTVTLYWQALQTTNESLTLFLHLVQQADQPPLAQSNSLPAENRRPTEGWREGEIIVDRRLITLPTGDVQSYALYVGFYRPNDFSRLPVQSEGQAQPFDQLHLTNLP